MSTEGNSPYRACCMMQNWTPPQGQVDPYPLVAVQVNQNAWLRQSNPQWSFIEFWTNGRDYSGYVPTRIVDVGAPAAKITFKVPEPTQAPRPAPVPAQGPVLDRIMGATWKSIAENRVQILSALANGNPLMTNCLWGPHSNTYAQMVSKYMVKEAKTVMSSGQSTLDGLYRAMKPVGESHGRSKCFGIYIVIFKDLGMNTRDKNAVYIGQTLDFKRREKEHKALIASGSDSAKLYKVGATAREYEMFPLVVIPHHAPEVGQLGIATATNVSELTCVCLFSSWHPAVLYGNIDQAAGVFLRDFEGARLLYNMMKVIFANMKWKMDKAMGLNWQTPVLSHIDQEREWTSYYSEIDSCWVYYTRRQVYILRNASTTREDECCIQWRSKSLGCRFYLPMRLANAAGWQSGDSVMIQVEINMAHGHHYDHRCPYARIPKPCHNKEFEKLRSMGVRIQWLSKETRTWKYAYHQLTDTRLRSHDEYAMIIQGLSLMNTLTKTTWTGGPEWMPPLDRTEIRVLQIMHLLQEGRIAPQSVAGVVKAWPANNTRQENEDRLRRLVPANMRDFCTFNRRPQMENKARNSCDLCVSLADTVACRYNAETESCPLCASFNRPCTFTTPPRQRGQPNVAVGDLLKTGGPMENFGFPTHIQAMEDKGRVYSNRNQRNQGPTNEAPLIFDLAHPPFESSIEDQVQLENSEIVALHE